ncbi:MAG: ribonuclease P protein component [Patescibacteria group bacterium]
MLPRAHKLTKQRDIEELAKTGRRNSSVFFILKTRKNKVNTPRFVIVVSAKVSKKAVERNRIRRQVREIIRNSLIPLEKSIDSMVVVKQEALSADFTELHDQLAELYQKA